MKKTIVGFAIVLGSVACAQTSGQQAVNHSSAQAPAPGTTVEVEEAPDPTSSNPRSSLPAMSADRCVAEALGTATDPKTGRPAEVAVDPKTGKPLCPAEAPDPKQ